MKLNNAMKVIALATVFGLVGCGDNEDIKSIKASVNQADSSLTLGKAYETRTDCVGGKWSAEKDDRGRRFVTFKCDLSKEGLTIANSYVEEQQQKTLANSAAYLDRQIGAAQAKVKSVEPMLKALDILAAMSTDVQVLVDVYNSDSYDDVVHRVYTMADNTDRFENDRLKDTLNKIWTAVKDTGVSGSSFTSTFGSALSDSFRNKTDPMVELAEARKYYQDEMVKAKDQLEESTKSKAELWDGKGKNELLVTKATYSQTWIMREYGGFGEYHAEGVFKNGIGEVTLDLTNRSQRLTSAAYTDSKGTIPAVYVDTVKAAVFGK